MLPKKKDSILEKKCPKNNLCVGNYPYKTQSLLTVGKWTSHGWRVNKKPNAKMAITNIGLKGQSSVDKYCIGHIMHDKIWKHIS
jgi:hypothetical protein